MRRALLIPLLVGLSFAAHAAPRHAAPSAGNGSIEINVTDVLGHDLHARVELQGKHLKTPVVIDVPKGHVRGEAPAGTYKAYISVYSLQVPVLVDVQDVTIKAGDTAYLLANVLEGSAGNRTLMDFDKDCDFAIDRVEVKCGTNPEDAGSIPGREPIPSDTRILENEERWYRGELHAHSNHGAGKESVAELVRRAEKTGLDFLAIADLNTVDACLDPGFKSNSVVLIPALEWGDEKRGVALIYGPKTFPAYSASVSEAQAIVDLVQAQGGFYAIAHPCSSLGPWQWGLGYVNGVEVWCRDWRALPPITLDQLSEDSKERIDGKLVSSVAYAAASTGFSANGQAMVFYDSELVRGLKAAIIAGSYSSSPEVPLGAPVTYVYAKEKSLRGILGGMQRGRTFVSRDLKGPRLRFTADVLSDGKIDVSLGGIVPLEVPTTFEVTAERAKGNEVQILLNGQPLISKTIESDAFTIRFPYTPMNYSEFRARITGPPKGEGFGEIEVLAMTSPIYAQELDLNNPQVDKIKKEQEERRRRQTQTDTDTVALPSDPTTGEIIPKWKF